jgi:hypothetical protein
MQHLKAALQTLQFAAPIVLHQTACGIPQQVLSTQGQRV